MRAFVRWDPTGSEVLFSHWAQVYAVATDGSRLRTIVDVPGSVSIESVAFIAGHLTSADVSLGGERVAYVVCRKPYPERNERGNPVGNDYALELHDVSNQATKQLGPGWVPAWSPGGTHLSVLWPHDREWAMRHRPVEGTGRLRVMTAHGGDVRDLATGVSGQPRWSPDGRRLAFFRTDEVVVQGRNARRKYLYIVDVDGTDLQRLTLAETPVVPVSDPVWSPDDTQIAFANFENDMLALYSVSADGTDARRVTAIDGWEWRPAHSIVGAKQWPWFMTVAWSPDGTHLLYTCGPQICVVRADGELVGRSPIDLRESPVAAWSPDGTRIAVRGNAFAGNIDGTASYRRVVLYTMAPDGGDVRLLVAADTVDRLILLAPATKADRGLADGPGCGAAVPAAVVELAADCRALLELRDGLDQTGELNWSADRPLAEWDGVVVGGSPPRVRELVLDDRGLWGSLGPALRKLRHLEVLNLGSNHLGGTLPRELRLLSDLRVVDLSQNYLMGTIPPDLGHLTTLEVMTLADNQLTGPIPVAVGQLTDLQVLDLSVNALTGRIPAELRHLGNLRELDFGHNKLEGPVPVELRQLLSNLRKFNSSMAEPRPR